MWMAYYEFDPFGNERADLQAGIVAAAVTNPHIDSSRHQPVSATDFMPRFAVEKTVDERADRTPITDKERWEKFIRDAKNVYTSVGTDQ